MDMWNNVEKSPEPEVDLNKLKKCKKNVYY